MITMGSGSGMGRRRVSEVAGQAALRLGGIREQEGRTDEAAAAFRQAAGGPDPELAAQAALRLGDLLERGGDRSGARIAYQAVATTEATEAAPWALSNLGAAIKQSRATIASDHLPTVRAHDTHLLQLFQNLVGNAIKYRSKEPPRIQVSAKQEETEWVFAVRDNGIGIDPQYTKQVFGIFTRLHGRKYPGTGIGLAICQKIVERYGGRIWVESALGKGATFYFTIRI